MKKIRSIFNIIICFIFVVTSSCISNIPNIPNKLSNNIKSEINKQELYKKVIETVKNKKLYEGPIDIKINTGLNLPGYKIGIMVHVVCIL